MTETELTYKKLERTLKNFLRGKGFFRALQAFADAKKVHYDDFRKDGVTRVFQHQIEICLQIITLAGVDDILEDLLIVGLLHDAYEDQKISIEEIRRKYGDRIAEAIVAISKNNFSGIKKSTEWYYHEMALNELVVIAKGCDRCHNLKTMIGVFSRPKQIEYVTETEDHTLPMLKEGGENFPARFMAIQNIRQTLKLSVMLIKEIHAAEELNGA